MGDGRRGRGCAYFLSAGRSSTAPLGDIHRITGIDEREKKLRPSGLAVSPLAALVSVRRLLSPLDSSLVWTPFTDLHVS